MTPEMDKALHAVGEAWANLYRAAGLTVRTDFRQGEGWPTHQSALGACIGKNISCFADPEHRSDVFWAIASEMAMWEAEFRGIKVPAWDMHNTPHAVAQYLMSHWVNAVSMLPDERCRQEEIDFLLHGLAEGVRMRAEDTAKRSKLN